MLQSKIIHSFSRSAEGVTMSCKSALICLKCSLLGTFLLFLQPVFAQSNWSDLDAAVTAKQKQLGKDLVIEVWKDDTLAHKKELGDFNGKTQGPDGGISRWLTAALVMVMVDEGKISLDDKVSTYLPEFAKYGKNYITLRICLANMTGIEDEATLVKKLFRRTMYPTLTEEVNAYAAREIRTNAGMDNWYGNIGTAIAARVLEVATKKNFDVLIKQKLFNPIGMRRTTFSTLDASAINPYGGAQSTPDDYIQFLAMLLNKGKYKGKQILTEASVDEFLRIETKPEIIKYTPKVMQGLNYTMASWALEESNGKATALVCPGFTGSFAMIDYCRHYAFLVLPKTPLTEERTEDYLELKKIIDEQAPSTCK